MDQTWSKLVVINTTVCLFIHLFDIIIIIILFFYYYFYLFIIIIIIIFFLFFFGGGYIKLMFNYLSFINSVHTRISNLHQGLTPA